MPVFVLSASGESEALLHTWHADPAVGLLLGAAAISYGAAYRAARRAERPVPPGWRVGAYLAGLASVALALAGPPAHLQGQLFTAHMVQHLLLMLVAAPLIVLGRPEQVALQGLPVAWRRALLRRLVGGRPGRRLLATLTGPVSVGVLFNGGVLLWHLPALYQAAVQHPLVHDLEHAWFLGTAFLYWRLLDGPVLGRRPPVEAVLLLVFATWMASDLLGATLTLAGQLLYPVYGALPKPWGWTPLGDQRLGGLVMWLGGGVYYAAVLFGVLIAPHLRRRAVPSPRAGGDREARRGSPFGPGELAMASAARNHAPSQGGSDDGF
jgi:putative membrane protein